MKNLLFVICFGGCNTFLAQETNKGLTGGFGHFAGSYETISLSELNPVLKTYGYNELPQQQLSFGGAGYFVINNILIGGGGASFSGFNGSLDSTVINMSGGYGYLSGGYVISTGKRSFFYPTIGGGAGGLTMQLGKKGATNDFKQQLALPRGRFQTGAGGFFLNFQVAWQRMMGTGAKQGWSLGLKAGYRLSTDKWKMDVNGGDAAGSPGLNLNGYYITLIMGGGALVGGD